MYTVTPHTRMRVSLLGLAHGDAFGETLFGPPEEATRRVAARALVARRPWRWTDDTAMALAVVETLERDATIDPDALMAALVRRFAAEPDRGYGQGAYTLLTRAAHGADWRVEATAMFGGQGSFGNGAAMRVAPLGAYFADDLDRVVVEAARSAAPTHAHPEGVAGAVAVAVAAALAWRIGQGAALDGDALLAGVIARTPPGLTHAGLVRARALGLAADPDQVAAELGTGRQVSAQDTVPWCAWVAARHLRSYEDAVWQAAAPLGDRDTNAAIVGGVTILAAPGGALAIPAAWRAATEPVPA
ncbi:MAG: ADP-ribosylglycohydrolase family protein [Myxococcales bacterium]|nr:ADP-ribosylglycohydrolase family protein [Myxococcales bacterium]